MGGSASKEPFPQSKHYSILDYGYCKVWKRCDSQMETMEQYDIVIDSQRMLQAYKRMWLLRAQEEAVVGVYYFTHRANKQLCGFYQQGSILTERIPYRLSQFSNLPYEEILFVLKVALRAYLMLQSEYGLFLVRSTMMGINLQKEVKVWHHTDFSAAEPENAHCRSMAEMLDSIVESVQLNAEVPVYYPKFSDFLKVNRSKIPATFQETLRALQTYIRMNKIPKCQNIPKLANHLRQAEGWQEQTFNSNFLTNLSNISQLNKSSYGKYSFRGTSEHNSSVSSSRKTLKNSPGYNIYTQKEVRQEHRTKDKDRSAMKSAKSQVISPLPPPERYQYSPKPLDAISDLRGRSIQKTSFNNNKIEIKIPSRRNAVSPPPQPNKLNTISSIDRRIIESPQPRFENLYTHKQSDFQETQPIRANRFHQNPSDFQRRNESISPSAIYYQRK